MLTHLYIVAYQTAKGGTDFSNIYRDLVSAKTVARALVSSGKSDVQIAVVDLSGTPKITEWVTDFSPPAPKPYDMSIFHEYHERKNPEV